MELVCKHFTQLTRDELFDIYKLRVAVFIVEQQCAYPEVDDADQIGRASCRERVCQYV